MSTAVIFEERQHFRQWWLRILLLGLNGMLIYGFVKQVILGIPFGDRPAGDATLIAVMLFLMALTALLLSMRLDTRIDESGVGYRFFPFQRSYTTIDWNRISKAYVRKYKPILEYGGWGIRYRSLNNRALNMSGNQGLQLHYDENKKLLLGTTREQELQSVLHTLHRQHQPV